jgi:hypothetical protein
LPKPALIRFELSAGSRATGQSSWIWELRASPDAAGGVTSSPPAGTTGSPATEPPTPPVSAAADCTVGCTLVDFLKLATGRTKPASALLRGLIQIRGDRSVFVALRAPMAAAAREYKAAAAAKAATAAAAAAGAAGARAGDPPSGSLAMRVVAVSTVAADGRAYATYTVRPALWSRSTVAFSV